MNKKFDTITIVLMAILGVILISVIYNYYLKTEPKSLRIDSSMNDINTDSIYSGDKVIITSNPVISGEEIGQNASENSGESGDSIIKPQNENPTDNNTSPIISSTGDISSIEKKEVLKELDQTLKELLDVIDLVTTVDETRLGTEESEVVQ